MSKATQNLLLIVIAGAVLWITLGTDEYLNYVRPGFHLILVAAALVLLALGAAGLRREWASTADDHHHHHGPRVAWLMCLPVLAIFIVAPPALGSFSASRDAGRQAQPPPPPDAGFGDLPRTGRPIPMTMGEFIGRSYEAQTGQSASLTGIPVELTGFVTPRPGDGDGWQVTRLKMACCAGDAVPFPVVVHGLARPPADAWVKVVGVWRAPSGQVVTGLHELQGTSVARVKKPKTPYE